MSLVTLACIIDHYIGDEKWSMVELFLIPNLAQPRAILAACKQYMFLRDLL